MTSKWTLAAGAAAIALASGFAAAQETTSGVRGFVTDESGSPIAGSTVTIRNESTGLTRTARTNASGQYSFRGLPVGGDYSVSVDSAGYVGERTDGVFLSLGQTSNLSFDLASGSGDEIVVTAQFNELAQVAVGPSATFGLETLETAPAINRNITDIIRLDPRIFVDESRGDINGIQCAGKNPRFNSFTLDGVRINDAFGLNSNGYPTERIPFSYDAVEQVAVELAPFDVEYGGFSACNINAVTKSGGNEFHGGLFVDYTNDSLRNDSLEGEPIETGEFDEYRYGLHIGGPIIKDKLFFFAAYEKLEGVNLFDRGVEGSGAVNEVAITQAEIDEIIDIAQNIYQYDPGFVPSSFDNEDEKLLVKLDWNITDDHRAAFTYIYNDGFNITASDGDLDEFELSNHLYERGAELNNYIGTFYSDWTENFSTEIRVGYQELDNRQVSVGGTDFGEIRIETGDVDVYIGGDDSRQSNKLNYEVFNLALKGFYDWNGHSLTFGYEREALEVFNLFVQHTETEIRFDGIENFRNGFADAIYYNNAPSNNPTDAAADWGYALNTLYFQDEFDLTPSLSIVAGLRYDLYTTDDLPPENPDFVADYGFSNSTNLDGADLLQPRFAFTWDANEDITVRGGVGLYSGGNPNVWLSNNYSSNNVTQFGQRGRSFGYTDGTRSLFDTDIVYEACEDGVPVGPGYCVQGELFDAVAGGTGDNFEINYLDPDFEIPSEWKFSLGTTYAFEADAWRFLGGEYIFNADLLWSRGQDTAIWLRGDLEQVGTTVGGPNDTVFPDYDSVREASFVLTNSTEGNQSFTASLSVAKDYGNGVDWFFGYSFNDAEDVNPMTSSVAFSNYQNRAFYDPQEQVLSTSNYNIKHRFTTAVNYEREFWADNATRLSAYGSYNSGQPYSLTFNGTIDPYGFTPFLDFRDNVLLEPGTRNAEEGSWWGKVDLKLEQEFPGLREQDKTSAFIIVDNFTNLLNDEWGVLRQVNFPNTVGIGDTAEARFGDASRYEIRFGLQYKF